MTRICVYNIVVKYKTENKSNKYLYIMNKKLTYQTPRVLAETSVQLERDFLKGSIVDDTVELTIAGQSVGEIDATKVDGESFDWNTTWEWE